MQTASDDLKALARVLADWAAPASRATLYLFGSRVRGDHKPDSNIDICIKWAESGPGEDGVVWWNFNNEDDFATINRKLPGPLAYHPPDYPWCGEAIAAPVVYQDRNVRCVWLRPK